jgi:hypothetical protein
LTKTENKRVKRSDVFILETERWEAIPGVAGSTKHRPIGLVFGLKATDNLEEKLQP